LRRDERALAALCAAYINFAEEKADEFRLAFRDDEGEMPEVARESLIVALQPLRDIVATSLKDARSKDEVERVVTGIWSGWHGYALLKQAGCIVGPRPSFDVKTAAATFALDRQDAVAAN